MLSRLDRAVHSFEEKVVPFYLTFVLGAKATFWTGSYPQTVLAEQSTYLIPYRQGTSQKQVKAYTNLPHQHILYNVT